jgi:hypothetical protein
VDKRRSFSMKPPRFFRCLFILLSIYRQQEMKNTETMKKVDKYSWMSLTDLGVRCWCCGGVWIDELSPGPMSRRKRGIDSSGALVPWWLCLQPSKLPLLP